MRGYGAGAGRKTANRVSEAGRRLPLPTLPTAPPPGRAPPPPAPAQHIRSVHWGGGHPWGVANPPTTT